jgi:anthranilate phosphoribosyltransferase
MRARLFAAGVSETIAAGIAKAREVIASGQALAKLVEMQELK